MAVLIKQCRILACALFVFIFVGCSNEEPVIEPGWQLAQDIPRLKIQTRLDHHLLSHDEVQSTEDYVEATLSIDGQGVYEDQGVTNIKIRGRGQSTFAQPKKPYKIKLPVQESLLGLPPGQDWALLANFQDGPLMCSMLAMKLGHILEMPFTPVLVPVEVSINNEYLGVYWLTAHKEVAPERIALDEEGLLLEFVRAGQRAERPEDKDFYQFQSTNFNLWVQIHHPSLHKVAMQDLELAQKQFGEIVRQWEEWEQVILDRSFSHDYGQILDKTSLAHLLIIYQFTRNIALNTPQSIYLHKNKDQVLTFGPLWDFDEAYGGSAHREYFIHNMDQDVLTGTQPGTQFFEVLLQDPELHKILKKEWKIFRQKGLGELRVFMANYVDLLDNTGAYQRDYARWYKEQDATKESQRKTLRAYEKDMNLWLDQRAGYMDKLLKDWKKERVSSFKLSSRSNICRNG